MIKGYYLYCIVEASEQVLLESLDVDVTSVSFQALTAIVHPVDSLERLEDEEKIKDLIKTHQAVIDAILEKNPTVIPFTLDVIIRGGEEELKKWLEENYNRLLSTMERIRNKAEYTVQIFWNPSSYISQLYETNNELKQFKEKSQSKQSGIAYLYEQRTKKALESLLESRSIMLFNEFYEKIKDGVIEIVVEKIKNVDVEKQMFLHVSCLIKKEQELMFGDLLDGIEKQGYSVRFTGPWPVYSFVN